MTSCFHVLFLDVAPTGVSCWDRQLWGGVLSPADTLCCRLSANGKAEMRLRVSW